MKDTGYHVYTNKHNTTPNKSHKISSMYKRYVDDHDHDNSCHIYNKTT